MTIEEAFESLKNGNRVVYKFDIYEILYIGDEELILKDNIDGDKAVPIYACEQVGTCLDDLPKILFDKFYTYGAHDIEIWLTKYKDDLIKIERRI